MWFYIKEDEFKNASETCCPLFFNKIKCAFGLFSFSDDLFCIDVYIYID